MAKREDGKREYDENEAIFDTLEEKIKRKQGGFCSIKKWYWEFLAAKYYYRLEKLEERGLTKGLSLFDKFLCVFPALFGLPYFVFGRRVAGKKWSPLIKAWYLESIPYSLFFGFFVGLCLFPVFLSHFYFGVAPYIIGFLFLLLSPIVYLFLFSLMMPTAVLELYDRIKKCPLDVEKMAVSKINSIWSIADFDQGPWEPRLRVYDMAKDQFRFYPVRMYGKKLTSGDIPRSSLGCGKIMWGRGGKTRFGLAEYCDNDVILNREQKKAYRFRLKYLIFDPENDPLAKLIAAEPTMEFRYTYLRHSKLLVRIDPIEGYDYAAEVPALLEQLNATIHPWLKDKVKL